MSGTSDESGTKEYLKAKKQPKRKQDRQRNIIIKDRKKEIKKRQRKDDEIKKKAQ